MKKSIIFFLILTFGISCYAQEILKSTEEEYYELLCLEGIVEKPTLGYRTLSDSLWNIPEDSEHVWGNLNLGRKITLLESDNQGNNWFTKGIYHGIKYKILGPNWFNSYNTTVPFGQDDGALWQGKGYNTSLTGGFCASGYGVEITFRPLITFSQNKEFEYMASNQVSPYGYFWGGCDAPQRFGDEPFYTFDFGDSEIRYSWYNFTLGFGTQAIWLGPAFFNPLLSSNNAATYPKVDLGLRKQELYIPFINQYIGTLEGRMWIGMLSESEYFDEDSSNDKTIINGFSLFYEPPFFDGLILGANKICLSKPSGDAYKYLNPFYAKNNYQAEDLGEDQKVSLTFEYNIPKGQVDLFGELGIDDKPNNKLQLESILTHFWHCATYTVGFKKAITYNSNLKGELQFEWNNTEMSQDMQFNWPTNFGFHNKITQGYTNKGQWLGSGTGYGGQNQYISYKLYYPKGYGCIFLQRNNPDNNYLFKEAIYDVSTGDTGSLHARTWNYFKTITSIGLESNYFVTENFDTDIQFIYSLITNPLYNQLPKYTNWHNFTFIISGKYNF